jgi:phage/plasmid-like protein (TIGR03299 family)
MGTETMEWYNSMCLIGMTDERGTAWHFKKEYQSEEPNHYPQGIPVADVHRRLFNWEAVKTPVFYESNFGQLLKAENTNAIIRNDTSDLFGLVSDGYQTHQYSEWLVKNLQNLIDDDLVIGSAILLKNGAVACVTLEMPESIEVLEGFSIRPHLMATTSHNSSIATTYKKVTTFVVCDNTYAVALRENGEKYSIRHTKNSGMKIQDARDALGIVHKMTEEMTEHIEFLSQIKITPSHFEGILNQIVPLPLISKSGDSPAKNALTRAENKREVITGLYKNDPRVAPWQHTGLGVVQAFNTYAHHFGGTDKNRIERNIMNILTGASEKADKQVLSLIGA